MSVIRELTKVIKEEGSSIEKYGEEILQAVINTTREDEDKHVHSFYYAVKDVMKRLTKSKGKHAEILVKICTECIRKQRIDYYKLADVIFESKNYINWKGRVEEAETIIDLLLEPMTLTRTKRDDWWSKEREPAKTEQGEALGECTERMIQAFMSVEDPVWQSYRERNARRDKCMTKLNRKLMKVLITSYERTDELSEVLGRSIVACRDVNFDGTEDMLPDLFRAIKSWLRREENDITEYGTKTTFVSKTISSIGERGIRAPAELSELLEYILTQELDGQPMTGYGEVAVTILSCIVGNVANTTAMEFFIPGTVKLMTCGCEQLEKMATSSIGALYQQVELLLPYTDTIIEVYMERMGHLLLTMVLQSLFKRAPEKVLKHFDKLVQKAADDIDDSEKGYFYLFLGDVAKRQPEMLLPYLENLVADTNGTACPNMAYKAISEVAALHPNDVDKYSDKLIEAWDNHPIVVTAACTTMGNIGRTNEEMADKYLTILVRRLATVDPMEKTTILREMKRIGQAFKEPLKKHRAEIGKETTGSQPGLSDMAQSLIDFMEDRTLQDLSTEVAEQRDDIDDLENRVTGTEDDIIQLDEEVNEQGEKLENVQNVVAEQGERLDNMEEIIDELIVTVDEIDHKTITNAPKWSRDVAKIMNVEGDYDWRFLAVRLGYSGEDIRNWAISPDPTMSILAEWYTTHKSSDATFAILTALQDMGRTDAADIVETALKNADKLVPKARGELPDRSCPIFVSYQWDHQPEVRVIKDHLEMAGYRCWMDIGQMGGGDRLFSKINEGMRAAKIVLCMVTMKYAKSENCNKEVNLANLLNKPIIPILIEDSPWPPEGSMSMLFAQLLYIQFFATGEYVRGEKFWPEAKFHELLGQIAYSAAPDPEIITSEYQDWVPEVEKKPAEVVTTVGRTVPETVNGEQPVESQPTVFISYQWDMQPQIKKLFNQLTRLGFPCWLDIMQMGGGDPLYAKIDNGVRNAKVILCCVTSKYSLSANCRREVSLSDALRKPIIPLLLEEDMTWPPAGPMSMTFTQLLYIDFTKESSRNEFRDEKFNELVGKIKEYVQP